MRRARMESSQFLRTRSSTRTKLLVRERSCERNLFLFQCEGVNIVSSHVANQHRGVCRIKTHPKVERPCERNPSDRQCAPHCPSLCGLETRPDHPRGAGSK